MVAGDRKAGDAADEGSGATPTAAAKQGGAVSSGQHSLAAVE